MAIVDISQATIGYRKKQVISNLDLQLDKGVTVLLGPNGAGKTTLMKAIIGAVPLKSGKIQVNGKLGYLEQDFTLMGSLSVLRTVAYAAWAAGAKRKDCFALANRALQKVNLESLADKRVKTLSGGQRQRLGLACSIVINPDVVVLDEPTVGIDPAQRIGVRQNLTEIAKNAAVITSTHIVDDAAHMADRILLINNGKIIFDGDLAQLENEADSSELSGLSRAEQGYLSLMELDQFGA